jgi:hypothetical protein
MASGVLKWTANVDRHRRSEEGGDIMTDGQPADEDNVGDALDVEVSREKSLRRGNIWTLHPWWGRRPNVLARVASYVAITEEQQLQTELLTALGRVDVTAAALNEARSRVRDTSWRWYVEENLARNPSEIPRAPMAPSRPKVLDPFAGGGSIPMEASRLGCDAYAGDLNPVAYRILRASLEFPAKLIQPDGASLGSSSDGSWDGLINELHHWATKIDERVIATIGDLFPPEPYSGSRIDRYFWFLFVRCQSPTCGVQFPAQRSLRLNNDSSSESLAFTWHHDKPTAVIVQLEEAREQRGFYTCPSCGFQTQSSSVDYDEMSWKVCLVRQGTAREFAPVSLDSQDEIAPWSNRDESRLQKFLTQPETKALHGELPDSYSHLKRKGLTSFDRLFSPRQLVVAAEYINAIRDSVEEMRRREFNDASVEALSIYLSLFVGHLVNRNSRLCSWNPARADSGTTFQRMLPILPRVFIEIAPNGLLKAWVKSVEPAIHAASEVSPAANIYQRSAAALPFEQEFFDAVVTDPPYYDAVPYSDLADFFWVWERMIVCEPESTSSPTSPYPLEILPGSSREASVGLYRTAMLLAFKEVSRVLKPGRKFCLIFSGRVTESFQEYIDLCREAGMELIDVKRVPEQASALAGISKTITYLIYLRKPSEPPVREPLQTTDGSEILDAAASGKPVLYAGLAELMAERLSEADLKSILPIGGRGASIEQLMEVLADRDPREVLVECFGKAGLREIANQLRGTDEEVVSPIEVVLTHFGFAVPQVARPDGAPQARHKISRMVAKISQAAGKEDMRGPFLEVSTAIERLLKLSIWGWAQLIFGSSRDLKLLAILEEANPNRRYDLDKLYMGDVLVLFRELPKAMAAVPNARILERKFGRTHVYSNKKTKFVEVLDNLISLRNKVEHDKDGYWTNIDTGRARTELVQVLSETERLLSVLVDARAIPVVVEPIKEIRDKWNRRAYLLSADDGTEYEARFSSNLVLGSCYLYFGSDTNPRPVDPLVLNFDEVGKIA